MSKIAIYQVFTRLFGNKNNKFIPHGTFVENGVGTFADFTDKALQEIKKLGITHIWYTGVIEHATCMEYPEHQIKRQHPATVKGRAGSPYAISDYYDVNPYLALDVEKRMEEFEQLVSRTHKNGMQVIIDFVPNHVARQYSSDVYPEKDFGLNDDIHQAFSPANDYYYLPGQPLHYSDSMGTLLPDDKLGPYKEFPAKVTGNNQFHAHPSINDWYETVKLNYGVDYFNGETAYFEPVPPLWDKMLDILTFWASKKVDAFRCDMAEMVPVEFWNYVIPKLKGLYPNLIFIAEVYNPQLYHSFIHHGRFDYLYDKVGLYDTLRLIINNREDASAITQCWQHLNNLDAYMLRFLENHDEHRIASTQFCGDPWKAIPALLVSASLHTGPVMLYFGQEVGETAQGESGYSGDDGKTTIFDFWGVPEHQKWMNLGKFDGGGLDEDQKKLRDTYRQIMNLAINEPAISQGRFYDLMWMNHFEGGPDHRFIYAYLRYFEKDTLLFVLNFDNISEHRFRIKIPEHALNAMGTDIYGTYRMIPVFGQAGPQELKIVDVAYLGIETELPPNSALVYRLTTV
ncbi:MAG: alpha-amylase family glycosyl hydrolase [Salinivirgaceae bacterium]